MTTRAAVLALAAPLLLTAPALADKGHGKRGSASVTVQTSNGSLHFSTGHGNGKYHSQSRYGHNRGYGLNEFGQSPRQVKQLKRQAIRSCRRAIRREASYIGFRDVDFESGARARQIGPAGFRVTFHEVEFEGRRRDFDRRVSCTVRRGTNIRNIEGIPQPGRRGHNRKHHPYS